MGVDIFQSFNNAHIWVTDLITGESLKDVKCSIEPENKRATFRGFFPINEIEGFTNSLGIVELGLSKNSVLFCQKENDILFIQSPNPIALSDKTSLVWHVFNGLKMKIKKEKFLN